MEGQNRILAFLDDIPRLHSWDGGDTWNTGGFTRIELGAIIDIIMNDIGPQAVAAETGAGNSTVAMVLAQASRVISVAPDKALFDRIFDACRQLGCDLSPLIPHVSLSEEILPVIATEFEANKEFLDFALIDGGHGWPTVFVDFCYLNRILRKNGLLMIDDIQIYAVKELVRLLLEDQNFCLIKKFRKTLIFKKITDVRYLSDFGSQPYIRRRTKEDRDAGAAFDL